MTTLSTLQTTILDLLQSPACSALAEAGVVCLAENKGDIIAAIDSAIAQVGICALVVTPTFKADSEASRRIVGTIDVVVQVFETPAVNRTRAGYLTALDTAELIATTLNLLQAGENTLVFRSIDTATVNNNTILYNVRFTLKTVIGEHTP
jgi:hypothetical protein